MMDGAKIRSSNPSDQESAGKVCVMAKQRGIFTFIEFVVFPKAKQTYRIHRATGLPDTPHSPAQ